MTYEEEFAQILSDQGLSVDASIVPGQDSVDADLQQLSGWLGGLEQASKDAIDEVTADNPVKAGLADPSVAIVSSIGGILAAFDAQAAAISISSALDTLTSASAQAAQASGPSA